MKKQHKIVSLLLVMSLLLGSLVFTTSASTSGADSTSTESDGDTFEPTATIAALASNSNYKLYAYNGTGTHITAAGLNNMGDDLLAYIVTPADGSTPYLQLVSQADDDSKFDNHFQYTWTANDGSSISYDASTPVYVVYEMDIATENDMIHLYSVGNVRTGANGSGSSLGGGSNTGIFGEGNVIDLEPGEFHRYTIVHDFANNQVYHFLDGVKTGSVETLLNSTNLANWQAGTAVYSGIKLQAHSSYANSPLVEGESLLVANVNATVIRGTDAAGTLPTAITAGNLSSWDGQMSTETPVVPDLATVNGVTYNNSKEASAALSYGTSAKEAEILRDSATKITVACSAVIDTNGCDVLTYADDVTYSQDGNTVTVTNTVVRDVQSSTDVTASGTTFSYVKSSASGNLLSNFTVYQYYYVENGRTETLYTNLVTGNSYIYDTVYPGGTSSLDAYVNWDITDTYYTMTDNEYVLVEFDAACDDYSDTTARGEFTCYGVTANPNGGCGLYPAVHLSAADIPEGEFAHITLVAKTENNTGYVFVNGKLTGTIETVCGKSGITTEDYLGLVRWYGKTGSFYYDNVYINRVYDDAMATDIANGYLGANATSVYSGEYEIPQKAPLASVNGKEYTAEGALEIALISNDELTVEFFRLPASPVTLRANATVNTNGFDFGSLVTLGDGCEQESVSGNYVTVTCPYITHEMTWTPITASEWSKLILSNKSGNLITAIQTTSNIASTTDETGKTQGYQVTNTEDGNVTFGQMPNGDCSSANTYSQWWGGKTITYNSSESNYFVLDFDVNVEGTALGTDNDFRIYSLPMIDGSRSWSGTNIFVRDVMNLGFVHITIVLDVNSNIGHVFVNNEFSHTLAHPLYANGTTLTDGQSYQLQGFRVGHNTNHAVMYDNVYLSYTQDSSLATVISSGDLSSWSGSVYDDSYEMPTTPSIATVNGVKCKSVEEMCSLIVENPHSEVEILQNISQTVTVSGIASINTHGLTCDFVAAEGGSVTVDGEMVYVVSPNIIKESTTSKTDIYNAVKYTADDNLLTEVDQLTTGVSGGSWGGEGSRQSAFITNADTGNIIYNESANGNLLGGNEYIQFSFTSTELTYEEGYNEYLVFDYDILVNAVSGTYINSESKEEATASALPVMLRLQGTSTTSFGESGYFKNFDLASGELNHVTTVYSLSDGYAYTFVNGELTHSWANGTISSAGLTNYKNGETFSTIGFRLSSNSCDEFFLDNLYARHEKNLATSDSISTAISTGSISSWDNNIYTDDYEIPQLPPVATANGVDYTSESKLSKLLNGRTSDDVEVEFWRSPFNTIEVTVTATVETNGFANTVVAGENTTLDSEVGTVKYFTGTFKPTATYVDGGDGTTAGTFSDIRDNSVSGNIFSTGSWNEQNASSFRYFKYTDWATENPYYMVQPIVDKTTKNTYISVDTSSNPSIGATSYFIFDIDVATETEFIDYYSITVQQRSTYNTGTSDTDFSKVGDASAVYIKNYVTPSDEWAHLTIIGDIADNKQYIFVNGTYAGEQTMATGSEYDLQSHIDAGDFKCIGARVNMPQNVLVDQNDVTLIDNLSLRYYDSDSAAYNVETYIAAGSLEGYALAAYGRMGETIPALATVNGTEYGNINTASEALTGHEDLDVVLERQSLLGNVTVASTGTVVLNGIGYETDISYDYSEEGGIVTVTYTENTGLIIVNVNGKTVYEGYVRLGTYMSEILASLGAHDDTVVGNGHIFTDVTWTNAPGRITGSDIFSGNGTEFTQLYYAYDPDNSSATYHGDSADEFRTILFEASNRNIILNGNISIASGNTLSKKLKNVYLNGYELSFGGGNHAMTASSSNSINYYGPGTINDMNSKNTQALLFAAYGWTGKITLNNLTVNTSQALFQLRSGNAEINNCEINSNSSFDCPLFQIGEDYNGSYSTTPVTLDIIDSRVNFRTSNAKNYEYQPMIRQKIVFSAEDPAHVINITGSEINSQGYIIDALNSYKNADGTDVIVTTGTNLTLNVSNSSILAQKIANPTSGSFEATVNFIDNVKVNSTADLTYVNVSGLTAVKSNDHAADVLYSTEYATVTWADGTVEYWADGSVPTNASYPFAKVSAVEAGQSYAFTESYSAAPFSLKGNLTLGANIAFNLYVPADADLRSVSVNGVSITPVEKAISVDGSNVLYNCYTVTLTTLEAVSAFDVVFTLADTTMIARSFSVADYASKVYSTATAASEVMSATLQYIVSSAKYFGYSADRSAIDSLLTANPATTKTLPESSSADASALSDYVSGVQLNVADSLKFRFNLENGADGSLVKVTVNGVEKNVEVHQTYVEVELRAYEMGDMMTIAYGDLSGTYDLASYIVYANRVYTATVDALASNSKYISSHTASTEEISFYTMMRTGSGSQDKGNILSAIYSYYVAANDYVTAQNNA